MMLNVLAAAAAEEILFPVLPGSPKSSVPVTQQISHFMKV